MRDFTERLEISVDDPILPLEGPLTDEQRALNEQVKLLNEGAREALKANRVALLEKTDELRARQARRRRFTVAALVATGGASIIEFIALFA